MSAARARDLRLAVAWRHVAGETLAARVSALRVRRGVLEVEAPDITWEETLGSLLPSLAGRIAAMYPKLGVRKCRLIVRETHATRHGEALPVLPPEQCQTASVPDAANASRTARPVADPLVRLRALGERYLARSAERSLGDQKS